MTHTAATHLDERGRACPAPVIALGRAATGLGPGATIELLADDPAARTDVPAWCRIRGATLVQVEQIAADDPAAAYTRFVIRI